jgi:hypothetical protein
MHRLFLSILALAVFSGCGGGKPHLSAAPFLVSGPYVISDLSVTGSGIEGPGSLTQSGSTVSGVFHFSIPGCLNADTDVPLSGSISSDLTLSLSSQPINGVTISFSLQGVVASLPNNSLFTNLKGSFLVASPCGNGSGTALVDFAGSYAGNWVLHLFPSPPDMVASLVLNAPTGPDAHGQFNYTGTATFTGTPCFTSGTITGQTLGTKLTLQIATNDSPTPGMTSIHGVWGFDKQEPGVGSNFFGPPVIGTFTTTAGNCAGTSGMFSMDPPP